MSEPYKKPFNDHEIKSWIERNPKDATTTKELFNYVLEEFDVPESKMDDVYGYCIDMGMPK